MKILFVNGYSISVHSNTLLLPLLLCFPISKPWTIWKQIAKEIDKHAIELRIANKLASHSTMRGKRYANNGNKQSVIGANIGTNGKLVSLFNLILLCLVAIFHVRTPCARIDFLYFISIPFDSHYTLVHSVHLTCIILCFVFFCVCRLPPTPHSLFPFLLLSLNNNKNVFAVFDQARLFLIRTN